MFRREMQGALVSPWVLMSKEARIVTIFGKVYSSVEVETITGESTPFLAEETFAALMSLADLDTKPIAIILNNRGGSMTAAMLIIDAVEHLQARGIDVLALVIGSSMGVSTAILSSGTVGHRYALKRLLIHLNPLRLPSLKDFDTDDYARITEHNDRLRERLYSVLAEKTKLPEFFCKKRGDQNNPKLEHAEFRYKQVKEGLGGGDLFFSPEEALEAGIIDRILMPGDSLIDKIFHVPDKEKHFGFGADERRQA